MVTLFVRISVTLFKFMTVFNNHAENVMDEVHIKNRRKMFRFGTIVFL